MLGPDKNDGSLESTISLAKELHVLDRIALVGPIDKSKVPDRLSTGDIFLNTSNVDNTPISVLEAMACGLPVVSTNVGGIPYLLEDGKDALLVPPDDAKGMANAIRRITREPGLAEMLSKNARQKVEQFNWTNVLPRWEALLTSALER
jgi:glycosyltransferase involved in cell wall biosynthesis